jgi:hypothetical protein
MPIDRGVLEQQLQMLGESSRWWGRRELRDLPAVLDADERILAISHGKIARVRLLRRSWLIVVTGRRLLCLRSSGRVSWSQLEMSADQITRLALRVGLFRGRVLVEAADRTYRLLVPRDDAYKLLSALASLGPGDQGETRYGPTRMVQRVMDHVLALPAAAFQPGATRTTGSGSARDTHANDQRVQTLEDEVQELRKQVDFLEQLLRERHESPVAADRMIAGGDT